MENQSVPNLQDPQQTNNTPVEQTPVIKQKINLLWSVLIILFISAVVFGFGGYYLGLTSSSQGGNNSQKSDANIQKNVTNDILEASPTPATNTQISNWETYTISSIGLTFQYPKRWSVAKSPGLTLIVAATPNNSDETGFVPVQISIDSATDANGNIHFDAIEQAKTHYLQSLSSEADIKDNKIIGGKLASSIEGKVAGQGPGSESFIHYTFIQLNNQVLVIQLGDQDLRADFDTILSTFKFIN